MPKENLWQSQQTVSKTISREPPPKRGFIEISIQAFNDNPPLSLNAFCICRQREHTSAADWDKGGDDGGIREANYNTICLQNIIARTKYLTK